MKRKITIDAIEAFNIGYCDSKLDRYYQRVMFPILNQFGDLQAFQGRAMFDYKKQEVGKYIHDKHFDKLTALFGINLSIRSILRHNFCIVVEGPMDAVTGWLCGLPTVATLGTVFSDYQAFVLKQLTDNIVFIPDNDTAGKKFIDKTRVIVNKFNFSQHILTLPKDIKDLNDLYVSTNKEQTLKHVFKQINAVNA